MLSMVGPVGPLKDNRGEAPATSPLELTTRLSQQLVWKQGK